MGCRTIWSKMWEIEKVHSGVVPITARLLIDDKRGESPPRSSLLLIYYPPEERASSDQTEMRFLRALGGLLTSLAAVTNVVGVQLQALTPSNFKDSTSNGLWLIEYYSPRCPHCRNFEPTWEKLVQDCEAEIPSVHLAQVNCLMYGGAWLSYAT
jgi:hypothetical protein